MMINFGNRQASKKESYFVYFWQTLFLGREWMISRGQRKHQRALLSSVYSPQNITNDFHCHKFLLYVLANALGL